MTESIIKSTQLDESVKQAFIFKSEVDDQGITYTGAFYKDKRHGYGKLVYGESSKYVEFSGQFMSGYRKNGLLIYKNGDKYLGQFYNDK